MKGDPNHIVALFFGRLFVSAVFVVVLPIMLVIVGIPCGCFDVLRGWLGELKELWAD